VPLLEIRRQALASKIKAKKQTYRNDHMGHGSDLGIDGNGQLLLVDDGHDHRISYSWIFQRLFCWMQTLVY
jgi:hypothetical protein